MTRWYLKNRILAGLVIVLTAISVGQAYLLLAGSKKVYSRTGQPLSAALEQSGIPSGDDEDWLGLPSPVFPPPPSNFGQLAPMMPGAVDAFAEIDRIRKEMDRMMNQAFTHANAISAGGFRFTPEISLKEDKTHYIVTAELPGTQMDDLKIELENDQLTISGTRTNANSTGSTSHASSQTFSGTFRHSFTLPGPTKPGSMRSKMENGVLTITIEKA